MKKISCFIALLISCSANAGVIEGFTGGYDVSNWTQTIENGQNDNQSIGSNNPEVPGYIDTAEAPASILIVGNNENKGPANTDFTIAALGNGEVRFDWFYDTYDIQGTWADPFGYLLNGTYTQLSTNFIPEYDFQVFPPQSGTVSFAVNTGDNFGFRATGISTFEGPSYTTISNFFAPSALPVPTSVALFGIGLIGLGLFRKSM